MSNTKNSLRIRWGRCRGAFTLSMALSATLIGQNIQSASSDSWKRLPDMAGPRWEAGTVVRDNKLYVFGGYRMPTKACKRVDVSDLALLPSGQWQALAELPRPLSSPVAAILRDQLFIGGGSPNGATPQTAMWVWNTAFSLP